jgi:hypothetical protein
MTFGYHIKKAEVGLTKYFNKDKISYIREKIKDEMKNAINKDKILDEEDAKIINDFFNKLITELNKN